MADPQDKAPTEFGPSLVSRVFQTLEMKRALDSWSRGLLELWNPFDLRAHEELSESRSSEKEKK